MRKYIVGAIFGALLMTAFSASAEVSSVIGKVVDGAFSVKINDKSLNNQAVVIEGTSYLPVREIGEALGMDIKFDADLGIELQSKAGKPVDTNLQEQKEQILRSRNIEEKNTRITQLMNDQIANDLIIAPYETPAYAGPGKSKDDVYDAAVKKRSEIKVEIEQLTKERDAIIKEQNDYAKKKQDEILAQ
ncbi:stalk domain-containing protein [Paenibacillus anseongense]|uniref:stalk domain-containing protein n=1 Tax=Paenibacillus anseongense TaxID=2682845 RepID=UPI002DBF52A1|nr:hypothetical protein [Paenibacillus anseongense]MEC0265129.1 hypothetical protein [Paenibacillus anseongense]